MLSGRKIKEQKPLGFAVAIAAILLLFKAVIFVMATRKVADVPIMRCLAKLLNIGIRFMAVIIRAYIVYGVV